MAIFGDISINILKWQTMKFLNNKIIHVFYEIEHNTHVLNIHINYAYNIHLKQS